jgi:adenylate kinase
MKKIIFLGPPSSGKGIMSQRVAPTMKAPHISTGELFRQNLKDKTKVGLKAKEFMEKGELVPDKIVIEMLRQRIEKKDCEKGFILDGFPRTIPQARALSKLIDPDLAVYMNVTDHVVIARNATRVSCKDCGQIYNLRTSPPKKQGICNNCQGQVIRRKDAEPEIMKKRLKVYQDQTQPLINFYKDKGVLTEVFCDKIEQTPDETFQQVMDAINRFLEKN